MQAEVASYLRLRGFAVDLMRLPLGRVLGERLPASVAFEPARTHDVDGVRVVRSEFAFLLESRRRELDHDGKASLVRADLESFPTLRPDHAYVLPPEDALSNGRVNMLSPVGQVLRLRSGVDHMAERHLTVRRHVDAPCASVWAVCADFPNLADHWGGLKASRSIGDQMSGLGARREVHLKPLGALVETVTAWEEGRALATTNQPSALVPFKHAEARLTLEPEDHGTAITFDYRYEPRGGPMGRLTGPVIDRLLRTNFRSMLAAIDEAALKAG